MHFIPKWPPFLYSFVYLQISLVASFKGNFLLNFKFKNKATRANLQVNKRILKQLPFWNKVYYHFHKSYDTCISHASDHFGFSIKNLFITRNTGVTCTV